MKRDMDLARQILLEIEKQPFTSRWIDLNIESHSAEQVAYHVMLLHEAGLIEAINLSGHGDINWRPKRLTWEGHEFLEAARDNTRWKQATSIMLEKGGGIAFEILKQLLIQLMQGQILPHLL